MNSDDDKINRTRLPIWPMKSFSRKPFLNTEALDPIEQERLAQLQEHKARQGQGGDGFSSSFGAMQSRKKQRRPQPKKKPKPMSLEENLERTCEWLATTFPCVFDLSGPLKVLDMHILRDIKQHYKHHQEISHKKAQYPENLVIKAALNRWLMSDHYLLKLKEGEKKWNLQGEPCEAVTKEDENRTIELLGLTPDKR